MALLKAFVCQIALLGLYKLFLEQVVEDHLVPDELTRNCIVGLVSLLCFGIQIYTDKAEDDNVEAEECPKSTRESKGFKACGSAEEAVINEVVSETAGLYRSKEVLITRIQSMPSEAPAKKKTYSKNQNGIDSRADSSKTLTDTEVTKVSPSGIFAELNTNGLDLPLNITNVSNEKQDASVKMSNEQTISTSNGIPVVDIDEESDDEGIEIDKFVPNILPKEPVQLIEAEFEDISIRHEKTADAEPECLNSDAMAFSSKENIDETELHFSGGKVEKSGYIEEIISNEILDVESKMPLKDESEFLSGRKVASNVGLEQNLLCKDVPESLLSSQTEYTKPIEATHTASKNIVETSTAQNTVVLSTKQITALEEMYIAPVSIDISFIYACY